jgi:hypothetical protein
MKLTPEQKAFFEYGKALGKLEKFRDDHKGWKCVNFLSKRHYWRSGNYVCCETQDVTEQHALLIRDAWQKRAECRAWNIPNHHRMCANCKFWDCLVDEHPCSDCNSHHHNKWEPREKNKKIV